MTKAPYMVPSASYHRNGNGKKGAFKISHQNGCKERALPLGPKNNHTKYSKQYFLPFTMVTSKWSQVNEILTESLTI